MLARRNGMKWREGVFWDIPRDSLLIMYSTKSCTRKQVVVTCSGRPHTNTAGKCDSTLVNILNGNQRFKLVFARLVLANRGNTQIMGQHPAGAQRTHNAPQSAQDTTADRLTASQLGGVLCVPEEAAKAKCRQERDQAVAVDRHTL